MNMSPVVWIEVEGRRSGELAKDVATYRIKTFLSNCLAKRTKPYSVPQVGGELTS
jgi:hypothetical protein